MIKIPKKWFFINERNINILKSFNGIASQFGIIFLYKNFSINEKYTKNIEKCIKVIKQKKIPFFVLGSLSLTIRSRANGLFVPIEQIHQNYYNITKAKSCKKKLMIATTVHSEKEIILSKKHKFDITFISPAYKTNTHKNMVPLHTVKFIYLCHVTKSNKFALGGVDEINYNRLKNRYLKGFGGINYFKKLV